MIYSRLGQTGFIVSRVGFGCEPLGGTDWGRVNEALAIEAVERAVALGINLFDTADVYGLGLSEERLARALGQKRHDVVIVTKVGMRWEANRGGRARVQRDATPAYVTAAIEESLRRLRVDAIPVCLLHWPDPKTPLSETIEALCKARTRGLIRYLGLSNFRGIEVPENLLREVSVFEEEYSLISQENEGKAVPIGAKGLGFLAYGVLAQGLLSGKYNGDSTFDATDRRHRLPHFGVHELGRRVPLLDCLRQVAEQHEATVAQVATRWVLENECVTAAIVGAKSPAQIEDTAAASSIALTESDLTCLNHALAQCGAAVS